MADNQNALQSAGTGRRVNADQALTTSNRRRVVMADSDYLTTPLTDPNVSAAHTEQVER
jgi:hypothetical protein